MLRKLLVLGFVLATQVAVADEEADPIARRESATDSIPAKPSLVFPIPGDERASPHFADGEYGAFRPGRKKRKDCGRGHCGIDLCASVGAPVLAVKDGVVAQIDLSTSGEGGRWIRIEHEDGTSTWYMHLARVRTGLARGDEVKAGDKIATLGRTGVTTSPTHLHFALTVGAPGREKHLDPNDLLDAAALVPEALDAPKEGDKPKIRRSQRPEL